jgi:hypothetical protein
MVAMRGGVFRLWQRWYAEHADLWQCGSHDDPNGQGLFLGEGSSGWWHDASTHIEAYGSIAYNNRDHLAASLLSMTHNEHRTRLP